MNLKGLTLVLAGLLLFSPTTVLSREIDVRAGNVRASTRRDGSIYVNSGNTKVEVPARHSLSRWYPWEFLRFPWRTNCQTISNRSHQRNTQVTNSGHSVVESSVYTSTCR
jgi:hypothetical protein